MMIIKLAGIVIITAFCVAIIRQLKGEYAAVVSVSGVIVIGLFLFDGLLQDMLKVTQIFEKYDIQSEYINTLFKVAGITYVSFFASEICSSAGEASLSKVMIMGAKFEILGLCAPMITELINISGGFL